jgi:hypothetical protein
MADVNGDGRLDLIVANANDNTVSILLNTTPVGSSIPTFAAAQTFAVGTNPFGIAVADLARNGRLDIITANFNSNNVSVLMNETEPGATTASFTGQQTFAAGTHPQGIAVADFNADGLPDIAVTNAGSNSVSFLVNTTPVGVLTTTFAPQQTFAVGNTPVFAAVADFNGDGRPDLVVSNNLDNTVSVLLNVTAAGAPSVSFFAQQSFAVGAGPLNVAVADFNGDGRADIAIANAGPIGTPGNTVSVLLNTEALGSNTAAFAAQQTFAVGGSPQSVTAGDLDGDGRPDLVVSNLDDNTVSVLLNTTPVGTTTPTFAAQQTFASGAGPIPVMVGDLRGDGRMDIAVAANTDNNIGVLPNTTTPEVTTSPVVVGQFGTSGVQQFNFVSRTFAPLTFANANLVAANSAGDVVGNFPGHGVWLFRPTVGFVQINGIDAVALAIDPMSDVVASFSFNNYGTGEFRPSLGPTNWLVLDPGTASLLAMDALGDVAAVFPTRGVFLFRPATGFMLINGHDATALAMNGPGQIAASFPGFGVGLFLPGFGWELINGHGAPSLAIDDRGDVAAQFTGFGVAQYNFTTRIWTVLPGAPSADATLVGTDALGDVFAAFPGMGVWEFDQTQGWLQLTAVDASLLAVA